VLTTTATAIMMSVFITSIAMMLAMLMVTVSIEAMFIETVFNKMVFVENGNVTLSVCNAFH